MSNRMRMVLVTGATGAIGRAIVSGLAARDDVQVIAVGRDAGKLERLLTELGRHGQTGKVKTELADLSSRPAVEALGRRIGGPLDILINNAAVAPPTRQETVDGIELTFATNVLSYLWVTQALLGALRAGQAPRVVNVASYWAGDLDLDDLEFKQRPYDNHSSYRQSKQANRMLTVEWAQRLRSDGITVNSCHPGDVNSRLSNDLGFGGAETPETGAATPIWLATAADVKGLSGCYFEHSRQQLCRFAEDARGIERLARICDGYL